VTAEDASRELRGFAEHGCRGHSRLYECLSRHAADDAGLLEIARSAPPGQPVGIILLASVHYLLRRGTDHPLAGYYPSLTRSPLPAEDAYPSFRAFCLEHEEAIRALIASRRVQTNEVRRCVYWYPAFAMVAELFPGSSLALIEVGASAGLNLRWDRYRYDYGAGRIVGDTASALILSTELRGDRVPSLPSTAPRVAQRVGLDLNPLDIADADAAAWLLALVWPDQPERLARLELAIREFRADPDPLVRGDALEVLPALVLQTPPGSAVCVFHSHTLNQFAPEDRDRFDLMLAELSRSRTLVRLSAEWVHTEAELTLTRWEDGLPVTDQLARMDQHGRRLEWLVDPADSLYTPSSAMGSRPVRGKG
jgi:hypothetical protein